LVTHLPKDDSGSGSVVLIRLKHDKSVPPDGCRGFGWCLTGVPADAWHSRAWGRWAWL